MCFSIIEKINGKKIKIGVKKGGRINLGKFHISDKQFKRNNIVKQNFIYQEVKEVVSFIIPDSFQVSQDIFNIIIIEKEKKEKIISSFLSEFCKYLTDFIPDYYRSSSPVQRITAHTHQVNLARFFGFVEIHKEQFKKFNISESLDYRFYNYNLNIIRFYFQVLLNRGNSGQYLRLICRSFINLFNFVKEKFIDIVDVNSLEKSKNQVVSLQRSLQYAYVFCDSKQTLNDNNSWLDFDEFQALSDEFYKNSQLFVSSFSIDVIPSVLKNDKKLSKQWKTKYYFYSSILQQTCLISLLLSSIPTPRTSNLRNLCFYFKSKCDSNYDLLLKYTKFKINSLIEIDGLDDHTITIITKYLKSLYLNLKIQSEGYFSDYDHNQLQLEVKQSFKIVQTINVK